MAIGIAVVVYAQYIAIHHLLLIGLRITTNPVSAPTIRQVVVHDEAALSLLHAANGGCG